MGKIIIEIDELTKRVFKSKVTAEGKTIKRVLTGLIEKYIHAGKKKEVGKK